MDGQQQWRDQSLWPTAAASSAKEVGDVSNLCHIFQLTKADNLWRKIECHARTITCYLWWARLRVLDGPPPSQDYDVTYNGPNIYV